MEKCITISKGNSKLGSVPSFSLTPIKTCTNCTSCAKKCYAAKLARFRKVVRDSWEANTEAAKTAEGREQIRLFVNYTCLNARFFRWHVAGDIISAAYFEEVIIRCARENPGTRFLLFTKAYNIVNDYNELDEMAAENCEKGGHWPENLQIIFSGWGDLLRPNNPYGFPESDILFKGQDDSHAEKICGGNCTECNMRGVGCWELKPGETIYFREH